MRGNTVSEMESLGSWRTVFTIVIETTDITFHRIPTKKIYQSCAKIAQYIICPL